MLAMCSKVAVYTRCQCSDTGRSWAVAIHAFDHDPLTQTRTRARCFGTVFLAKCA